ncbi:PREDICTED: cell division control protein 45 homolog, partial [Priapulus caudatus]|uniref:Cell division control protein 45 homolog n=1 Tax=Priapulus caudatus TaxID=37621 RepID=A0ABM1F153_PRICU
YARYRAPNLRVLVLVSFNVDALCACKIIQALFQCDHIPYSIVPVQGQEDLLRAFAEHKEQIKYVLMLVFLSRARVRLNLVLYRHWSLFESMRHSRFVSCAFKVWTNKGVKRLMEFLADMGMPLVQVKQKFGSMDVQFKSHVKDWIEDRAEKYHLQRIVFGSFHTQYGYRNKYCASDVVYAVTALLEASGKDKTASDRFLEALDCLSRVNVSLLERGVEAAKLLMQAILSTVHGFIDMHQLISAGPFLYGFIQQGTPDAKLFSRPVCLQMLARFMLHAYVVTTRNKRLKSLPLVLTAPLDEEEGTSIVVGMPPHSEESQKNLFGKAFEQAAEKTNSRISQDFFDSSVIKMKTEDRSKFFDALISLMA